MTSLDTGFAARVRQDLMDTAAGTSALAVRRRRTRIGIGAVAGLAAAGLLTAGALVVVGIPGDHVITGLDEPVTVSGTGTGPVELGERPAAANAASIVLTCTSSGRFTLGNAVMNCGDVEVPAGESAAPIGNTMTFSDLPLAAGSTSFVVNASEGATWDVVANYANSVTTDWGVNANGQTYGTPNENGEPDLSSAQATNGAIGYIYVSDLWELSGSGTIPVYESDGVTVIGEFPIGDS